MIEPIGHSSCPSDETWCAYIDEALNASESRLLKVHLEGCLACFRIVASINQAVSEVQQMEPVAAPSDWIKRPRLEVFSSSGAGDSPAEVIPQAGRGNFVCPPLEAWCAYEDGAVSDFERHALQTHLNTCLACFRTLATIHRAMLQAEEFEFVVAPPNFLDEKGHPGDTSDGASSVPTTDNTIEASERFGLRWLLYVAAAVMAAVGLYTLYSPSSQRNGLAEAGMSQLAAVNTVVLG